MSSRRAVAGHMAKRLGATWETLFENSAWRLGCKVIRIPDGCRQITGRGYGGKRLIRVPSPFDFCLIKNGQTVYLDTKSTQESRFKFSLVDRQQLYWLSQCAAGGCRAGYAVEFRELKRVVFFPVEKLAGLQPRESLSPDEGLQLSRDNADLSLENLFYEPRQKAASSTDRPG